MQKTSDEQNKKRKLIKRNIKKIDIVIALLDTRKKAPLIIKKDMIEVMQSGSVIYDLATSQEEILNSQK